MAEYRQLSIKRIFRRMIYAWAYHSISLSPKQRCLLYRIGGACIGDNAYIGKEVLFDEVYPEGICIGSNSIITQGTKIITHFYDSTMRSFYFGNVTIGKNVFVGMNTLFVKPVTIGDNCIIGAGSVITDDIPANSIVAGNPCRIIKKM